jgi:hypothetical protein
MKHILNDISLEDKKRILEQHDGGKKLVIENFNKLVNNKLGTVKVLVEQDDEFLKTDWVQTSYVTPLLTNGYSQVAEIDLPDGTYKMGGSGYQININDSTDKETGYSLIVQSGIRGEWEGDITITSKKPSKNYAGIFFKNVGYTAPEKTIQTGQTQTLSSKVSTEGLKNVSDSMIQSPPFKGYYSGYVIGGTFNGVNYEWDFNGVEGMSGVRGMVDGQIICDNNTGLNKQTKKEITDAINPGFWLGFYSSQSKFVCYMTTNNTPKVVTF